MSQAQLRSFRVDLEFANEVEIFVFKSLTRTARWDEMRYHFSSVNLVFKNDPFLTRTLRNIFCAESNFINLDKCSSYDLS